MNCVCFQVARNDRIFKCAVGQIHITISFLQFYIAFDKAIFFLLRFLNINSIYKLKYQNVYLKKRKQTKFKTKFIQLYSLDLRFEQDFHSIVDIFSLDLVDFYIHVELHLNRT